ncbi:MAG: hypothetical protein AAF665_14245 [Pseudomonadota bacterium]
MEQKDFKSLMSTIPSRGQAFGPNPASQTQYDQKTAKTMRFAMQMAGKLLRIAARGSRKRPLERKAVNLSDIF